MRYRPFPTAYLPQPIRAFVEEGAKAIGCEPAYIALPVLSALASTIGNSRRLRLKTTWSAPAIVWTAVIGESGTTKSPAIELALRYVKARQDRAMRDHAATLATYEREAELHKVRHTAWLRRAGHAPEPGPEIPPEAPLRPTCARTWTDDATTEAMAVLLAENPRGLLMATDELSGWFGRLDAYKSGKGADAAKWLEFFDGRSVVVDRKGSGALHVPRAAVSLAGGIQPAILTQSLGETHRENGLLARLLIAHPPRRAKCWTDADLSERTLERTEAVFDRLAAMEMEAGPEGDRIPRMLTLSPDARARFIGFYNLHNREQVELIGDEASAWSKLEGYAARLGLILHLTRAAAGDTTDPEVVDLASMEAAIGLVEWFGREALRIYGVSEETAGQKDYRELIELIERRGGAISTRELQQAKRSRYTKAGQAQDALDGLKHDGLGDWEREEPGPQGGPPMRRFRLHPPDTQPA